MRDRLLGKKLTEEQSEDLVNNFYFLIKKFLEKIAENVLIFSFYYYKKMFIF